MLFVSSSCTASLPRLLLVSRISLFLFLFAVVGLFFRSAVNAEGKLCAQYDSVQIQLKWTPQAQFAGYMVAVELGYFRDECLEVYLRPGGPNIDLHQEVAAQRAQFGVDWLNSILVKREQVDLDMVVISQTFVRSANIEMAFPKSGIRHPTDLKDKRLCVWTSGNELTLRSLFAYAGLKWDTDPTLNRSNGSDANFITQSSTINEWLAGGCDAASALRYNELGQVLETTNPATGELYTENDLIILDYDHYNASTLEDALFVSRSWLEQEGNYDIAVRVLRACIRGWLYARDFPADVNTRIYARNVHQDWQNNEVSKLIFPTWPDGFGVAPLPIVQEIADRAYQLGLIAKPQNVSSFYRMDIAREAYLGVTGQLPNVERPAGWAADPENNVLGSDDVMGLTYQARNLRFCMNRDILQLCEVNRLPNRQDRLDTDSSAGIAMLVISSLALLTIAILACLLVYYRLSANIVASSLPFCLTICLGAGLFISAVFPSIGEAATVKCHLRIWLMSIGFIWMMGSFLIKTRRIAIIFNNSTMATHRLPNKLLFTHLFIMTLIELLLLLLFSTLSDYAVQTFDDPTSGRMTRTQCRIGNAVAGDVMTGLLFSYKIIILLWCSFLAWETKDVFANFNESSWLSLSTYNFTVISAVIVPIAFFLGLEPVNQFIVIDVGIVVAVTLSCLLLFVPKIILASKFSLPLATDKGRTVEERDDTLDLNLQRSPNGNQIQMSPLSHLDKFDTFSGFETSLNATSTHLPPAVPQNTRLFNNDAAIGQWQNGVKALSTNALIQYLRHLRMQEHRVRSELQMKGWPLEAINQQLGYATSGQTNIAGSPPPHNGANAPLLQRRSDGTTRNHTSVDSDSSSKTMPVPSHVLIGDLSQTDGSGAGQRNVCVPVNSSLTTLLQASTPVTRSSSIDHNGNNHNNISGLSLGGGGGGGNPHQFTLTTPMGEESHLRPSSASNQPISYPKPSSSPLATQDDPHSHLISQSNPRLNIDFPPAPSSSPTDTGSEPPSPRRLRIHFPVGHPISQFEFSLGASSPITNDGTPVKRRAIIEAHGYIAESDRPAATETGSRLDEAVAEDDIEEEEDDAKV